MVAHLMCSLCYLRDLTSWYFQARKQNPAFGPAGQHPVAAALDTALQEWSVKGMGLSQAVTAVLQQATCIQLPALLNTHLVRDNK